MMDRDTMMATLMGMGFDFFTVQKAINSGAQTVEEATERIMAALEGGTESQGPRLQLGSARRPSEPPSQPAATSGIIPMGGIHVETRTPFQFPEASTAAPVVSPQSASPSSSPPPSESIPLKSRYKEHRDDYKNLAINKAAEENKRFKLLERESKKRALEQIADDRKNFKEKQNMSRPPPEKSLPSPQMPTPKAVATDTNIQVRLPSGNMIKRRFPVLTAISEVFEFVRAEAKAEDRLACQGNISLLQAFPRRVFGNAELSITLADAGLVPTGSLNVLKAPSAVESPALSPPAAVAAPSVQADDAQDMEIDGPSETNEQSHGHGDGEEEDEDEEPVPVPQNLRPPRARAPARSRWGVGRTLMDTEAPTTPETAVGGGPQGGLLQGDAMDTRDDHDDSDEDDEGPSMLGPGRRLDGGMGNGGRGPGAMRDAQAGHVAASSSNRANRAGLMSNAIAQRAMTGAVPAQTRGAAIRRSAKSLRDMAVHCVAGLLSNVKTPSRWLHSLRHLSPDLGELIIKQLMSSRNFDRATLMRLKVCPIQNMVLDSYVLATDSLLQTLGQSHWASISKLSLKGSGFITDNGIWGIEGLKHLNYLDVSSCRLTDGVVNVICCLQELEHLNVSRTKISSKGIQAIASALRNSLCELNVSGCENISGNSVFQYFQDVINLEALSLSGTKISINQEPPSLRALQSLRILDVARTDLGDEDMRKIVSGFQKLEEVDLTGCRNVGTGGIIALGRGLKNLQSLSFPSRELEMDDVLGVLNAAPLVKMDLAGFIQVTDFGITHLANLSNSLKFLSLGGTRLTDIGLAAIKDCGSLTKLYLDRTAITDASAPHFKHLRQLEDLSLAETNITDITLLTFPTCDFWRIMKTLKLSRTDVTDEGVRGGIAALVNLCNLNLDGTYVTVECLDDLRGLKHLQPVRLNALRIPPSLMDL